MDLTRVIGFRGGEVRSTAAADDGRAGGGGPEGGLRDVWLPDRPGEAVWDRLGGGRGVGGFGGSAPACNGAGSNTFIQFKKATHLLVNPPLEFCVIIESCFLPKIGLYRLRSGIFLPPLAQP